MAGRAATGPTRRRATRTPAKGRLVLTAPGDNSRLFAYLIGMYVHRLELERQKVYSGDLDLARIAEIVGMAGVEPGMRDESFREKYRSFDNIVGVEEQRAVNASSVAQATGIPRETVRRKLKILQKLGFLVESRAGYVLKPGVLQTPERQTAFAWGARQTVQLMNDCLEQGVIEWVPATRKPR